MAVPQNKPLKVPSVRQARSTHKTSARRAHAGLKSAARVRESSALAHSTAQATEALVCLSDLHTLMRPGGL